MSSLTLTDIIVQSDLINLKEELNRMEKHIRANVPEEVLFAIGGVPNLQNKYGALLLNIRQTRATLRAFEG